MPRYAFRLLGHQGLGALSYVEEGQPDLKTTGVPLRHLQELALLAEKFEQDGAVDDDELSLLFQAGSSPGGARPTMSFKISKFKLFSENIFLL